MELIEQLNRLSRLSLKALQADLHEKNRQYRFSEISEDYILGPNGAGRKQLFHRVFLPADAKVPYTNVGWVLAEDIRFCMLCRTRLNSDTAQLCIHCHGCGNIFCGDCLVETAVVAELVEAGELSVCSLCCYGQEIVYCIPNRPVKIEPQSAPVESQEQKLRRLKSERQLEFQREALPRMATSQLLKANSFLTDEYNGSEIDAAAAAAAAASRLSSTHSESNQPVSTIKSTGTGTAAAAPAARRLSSYGAVTLVTPEVGYVLKAKRSKTGEKIFVNICADALVPANEKQSNAAIYMIINVPLELQGGDKDGGNSKENGGAIAASKTTVYDVIIHPDVLEAAKKYAAVTDEVNTQAMALIQRVYKENTDTLPVILRLQFNYKGQPNPSGFPPVIIRPIPIPAAGAFRELEQISVNSLDLNPGPEPKPKPTAKSKAETDAETEMEAETEVGKTAAPAVPVKRPSLTKGPSSFFSRSFTAERLSLTDSDYDGATSVDMSEMAGKEAILQSKSQIAMPPKEELVAKTVTQRCDLFLQYMHDSKDYGIDKVYKTLLLSQSEADKLYTSKGYATWLDHVLKDEVNTREAILFPESGYVIEAKRLLPSSEQQRVFVNICHHPAVGCLVASGPISSSSSFSDTPFPKPCPFILSRATEVFSEDRVSITAASISASSAAFPASRRLSKGNDASNSLVVDVVIASSVFLAAVHDTTGDLRDMLSVELLQRVAGCTFSSFAEKFELPVVAGGYYPHNTNTKVNVAPCINLTEQQKASYTLAILGKATIKGRMFGFWKEKYIAVLDKYWLFFKPRLHLEGTIALEQAKVSPLDHAICAAPAGSYCLEIASKPATTVGAGESSEKWECYWKENYLREEMRIILRARAQYSQAIHILSGIGGFNLNTIDEDEEEAKVVDDEIVTTFDDKL